MSQPIDVFVSSTSDDLREYRAPLKDAILNLGLNPIMMENFPAEGANAVQRCQRGVEEAEIFVGLYAHRYGWIPAPEQGGRDQLSITALEYEWAKERDIPRLCFLVDPEQPWTPKWIEGEPGASLLKAFKDRVNGEVIRKTFTTPENLVSLVTAALHHAVKNLTGEEPAPDGWRRPVPPLLAHRFVGRAEDRDRLRAWLSAAGDPVVVVRGAGGIGKTYLASQTARELADNFPGGVLWTGLGPTAIQPESVLARVLPDWVSAHPAGRRLDPADLTPDRARGLLAQAPGRLLAVLDDAWEVEPVRALQAVLPPGSACLITTRSPRIAALGGHTYPLAKLSEEDGCALLHDRLRVTGADPAPHAEPLRAIVRLLDGHALALDLAARQLVEQGIATAPRFGERLRNHLNGQTPFKLLELGRGEAREDSLEAALYLSYERLSEDAQAKFRALGVIAPDTSFSDRTAFAVWGIETTPPLSPLPVHEEGTDPREAAEDALAELLRWGLVERLGSTDRCAQHPLLHTYAAALARRRDEYDPALGRYTKHVIHDLAAQFKILPLQEWNTRILPDKAQIHYVGNMLAGYIQGDVLGTFWLDGLEALAQPEPPADLPEIDPEDRMAAALLERGEDFAAAASSYVLYRRVAEEGRRWLWMGLACARLHGNRKLEGLFLNELAGWCETQGNPVSALAYLRTAFPIQREVDDRAGEAITLNNIGAIYGSIREMKQALEYYERALSIMREEDDRAGEATTLNNIGEVHHSTGQMQQALEYYECALSIMREEDDRAGEATTLNNIGGVYDATEQPDRALEYFEQALLIWRADGDRADEATTLNNIGGVYDAIGQPDRALEYFEQALPIRREVGDREGEATTLNNIGAVYDAIGQQQRALEYYEQALPIRREVGDREGEAIVCFNIGMLLHKSFGRTAEAIPYVEHCVQIMTEIGDPRVESTRSALEELRRMAAGGA